MDNILTFPTREVVDPEDERLQVIDIYSPIIAMEHGTVLEQIETLKLKAVAKSRLVLTALTENREDVLLHSSLLQAQQVLDASKILLKMFRDIYIPNDLFCRVVPMQSPEGVFVDFRIYFHHPQEGFKDVMAVTITYDCTDMDNAYNVVNDANIDMDTKYHNEILHDEALCFSTLYEITTAVEDYVDGYGTYRHSPFGSEEGIDDTILYASLPFSKGIVTYISISLSKDSYQSQPQ